MAESPIWKVYTADNEYVASFKYPEHAASLVVGLGMGATIRYGHRRAVWVEGKEVFPAAESSDVVAETCHRRARGIQEAIVRGSDPIVRGVAK